MEKGIASTDDLDTLLMFSKDPLSKIERILSTLQAVQKDIEYVARDVEKRRGNIFVDNGGDLSTRYVESRNTIEADSNILPDDIISNILNGSLPVFPHEDLGIIVDENELIHYMNHAVLYKEVGDGQYISIKGGYWSSKWNCIVFG